MAWNLIAQTIPLKDLDDEWQLDIYQKDTTSEVKLFNVLKNRFKLRRGNASKKNKFETIIPTTIDFSIFDKDKYLTQLFANNPETNFQGILKKNGVLYFKGYLTAYLEPYDFTKNYNILKFTLYDGLSLLKNKNDFSNYNNQPSHLLDFINNCFSLIDIKLPFDLYMRYYLDSDYNTLFKIGINIQDYLKINNNYNYYNLLSDILKQLGLRLFQEDGKWYFIQLISIRQDQLVTLNSYDINGNFITRTNNINLQKQFYLNELSKEPKEFDVEALNECKYIINSKQQKNNPVQTSIEKIQWLNPEFSSNDGWNIDAGNPIFQNGSVKLTYLDQLSQISGPITKSEIIIIKFNVLFSIIYYDQSYNYFYPNPLFEIQYLADDLTIYYLIKDSVTWTTTQGENTIWQLPIDKFSYQYFDEVQQIIITKYIYDYYSKIYSNEFEVTVPNKPGKIKVTLKGGVNPNLYGPLQISAQHNYFYVERKIENRNLIDRINRVEISAKANLNGRNQIIESNIPFHDLDPFIFANFWYWYDDPYDLPNRFKPSLGWIPGNKTIAQTLAYENLQLNNNCRKGLDITFLRNKDINFLDYLFANLIGTGNRYYIPVYEEIDLVEDTKRFILLLHEYNNVTIKETVEYFI